MIAKKFYCDKKQGEIEVSFSKQELGMADVKAICEYIQKEEGKYDVYIFLGFSTFEEAKEYKTIQIKCNYSELKEKIVSWWKNHLKDGAADGIVDFVKNFVNPMFIKEIAEICRIHKVELSNGETFEVEVYSNKTIYFETTSGRKMIETVTEPHKQSDIIVYISNRIRELSGWEY